MSLAIGIKNSILVLLIILIVHFLIKNALLERKKSQQPTAVVPKQQASVETKEHFKQDLTPASIDDLKPIVPPIVENCKEETDDELYKYVYGDVASRQSDKLAIDDYFKGMDVTQDVEESIQTKMKCESARVVDDITMPVSTTCDPSLQQPKSLDKAVKADCGLDQTLPVMLLNEYDNESSMNGGDLYGNLSAFDNLASAFEPYSCGYT